MALRRLANRLSPLSVPILVFGLVAVVLLVVPPIAAGSMAPSRAYLIAGALLLLAMGYAGPYAAVVAVVTLPVLRIGSAGYASPESVTADGTTASRAAQHVVVGFGYVLASAGLGGVLVGAEMAGLPLPRGVVVPGGAVVGGLLTGGAFVALQLWRYRTLDATPGTGSVLATAGLGGLLALSPAVAYWLFGGRMGGL